MNLFNDMCFLCLVRGSNVRNVMFQGDDGVAVEEKLKSVVAELVIFKPDIPKYICVNCLINLNFVYTFREKCLNNLQLLRVQIDEIEAKTKSKEMIYAEPVPLEVINLSESGDEEESPEVEITIPTIPTIIVEDNHKCFGFKRLTDGQYECVTCNNIFENSQDLGKHISYFGKKPICGICYKTFNDLNALNMHKPSHNLDKRFFMCTECNKTFKYQTSLTNHISDVHPTEKTNNKRSVSEPNESLAKKIKTTQPENLSIENQTKKAVVKKEPNITNERKFKEVVIKKEPKLIQIKSEPSTSQQLPIKYEIQVKPIVEQVNSNKLQCNICDKEFRNIMALISHEGEHTTVKYNCNLCSRVFYDGDLLQRHMRTFNHSRLPISCRKCPLRFCSQDERRQHRYETRH